MWCLARLFPLMIGTRVSRDSPHWRNFLCLLTIMDYILAPVLSNDIVSYLKVLIEEHHQAFNDLYPSCPITPKLHYMIHNPDWISR